MMYGDDSVGRDAAVDELVVERSDGGAGQQLLNDVPMIGCAGRDHNLLHSVGYLGVECLLERRDSLWILVNKF